MATTERAERAAPGRAAALGVLGGLLLSFAWAGAQQALPAGIMPVRELAGLEERLRG